MIPLHDANPTRRTPVITLAIIAACVVVYGYQVLLLSGGERALDAFITRWGVVPAELVAALSTGNVLSAESLTLVTSQFLHGSLVHIGGNMLFLWIFGNNIEDRFGRLRFLVFYLVGGIVAGLTQVAIDPTSTIPTIGASGAIASSSLPLTARRSRSVRVPALPAPRQPDAAFDIGRRVAEADVDAGADFDALELRDRAEAELATRIAAVRAPGEKLYARPPPFAREYILLWSQ